jgi:2-hydroxycyclohexanecarboxyl-CoA dehydrogenase
MGRLNGKMAVVLRAAGRANMGQVIAQRFRDEDAQIVVSGRHMNQLERFAAEIQGSAVPCEIAKAEDLEALAKNARMLMDSIFIAVNATGWGLLKPFLETTTEELGRITAIQFTGSFQFCQSMVRAMTGGESLIQISSTTATIMLNDHAWSCV